MGGVVTNITAVKHRLATLRPDGRPGHRARPRRDRPPDRALPDAGCRTRRAIVGLQPKREEVILAGACIVRAVMEKLGKQTFTVSDRGLRHGLLAERFGT
jgi:exopolyphosphatase/guanosine-5'-triphosphate,3'-diphosphate pyrophosphatase